MSKKTWSEKFDKEFVDISDDRTLWKWKKRASVGQVRYFINQTIKEEIQTAFAECLPREMPISKENNLAVRAEYYRVIYKFKDNLKEYLKSYEKL